MSLISAMFNYLGFIHSEFEVIMIYLGGNIFFVWCLFQFHHLYTIVAHVIRKVMLTPAVLLTCTVRYQSLSMVKMKYIHF